MSTDSPRDQLRAQTRTVKAYPGPVLGENKPFLAVAWSAIELWLSLHSEIAQTNAAGQDDNAPGVRAQVSETVPASAAPHDDKRETPRTDALATRDGRASVHEWHELCRQLESGLNDMDYCHSQMVAEKDRWYARATKAEAERDAARSATGAHQHILDEAGKFFDWGNAASDALKNLLDAYERRIRSLCENQEQISSRPWECAEYIKARRILDAKPNWVVVADSRSEK